MDINKYKLISEYKYYIPHKSPVFNLHEEDDELSFDDESNDMKNDEDVDLSNVNDIGDKPVSKDNTVEVDVTDIVEKNDEVINSINNLTAKIEQIVNGINTNFQTINSKIEKTDSEVTSKINNIEKDIKGELIKRIPTPNEKLQMQSMNSFPFNTKLSDYWMPAKNEEYNYSISNPNQKQGNLYGTIEKQNDAQDNFDLKIKDIKNYNVSEIDRSF